MNNKLVVIGVITALATPLAAQAGVEVYGQARVSVDFNNNGDDNAATTATYSGCNTGNNLTSPVTANADCAKSNVSVSSNSSRLGFRGDEDLGNGMTALWQYETGVAFDSGTLNAEKRSSFVGLAGGFGSVLAGRLDSPYKSATNSWDPFVDTKADYNDILQGKRVSNTLAYLTPDMSGFKAGIAYVMPSVDTSGSDGVDDLPMTQAAKKKSAYSLSGNYDNGPLGVAVGYEVLNKGGSTPISGGDPDSFIFWKVGTRVIIRDTTTLALIYENQDKGGVVKSHNNIYFAATHQIGDTTLKLAYTQADKWSGTNCSSVGLSSATCAKTGASQFSLGVSQALSKNTEIYALYSQISNDDLALYGLGSLSAVTKASATQSSDPSVFSFGINHNFSSK